MSVRACMHVCVWNHFAPYCAAVPPDKDCLVVQRVRARGLLSDRVMQTSMLHANHMQARALRFLTYIWRAHCAHAHTV